MIYWWADCQYLFFSLGGSHTNIRSETDYLKPTSINFKQEARHQPECISNKVNGQDAAAVHITVPIPDTQSLSKYVPWRGIVGAAFTQMRKAITLNSSAGNMRNHISRDGRFTSRASLIFPSIKTQGKHTGMGSGRIQIAFPLWTVQCRDAPLWIEGGREMCHGQHVNFRGSVPRSIVPGLLTCTE